MKIDTKEPMHYGLLVRTTMKLWMDQGYSKRQFDEELQSIAGSLDDHWEETINCPPQGI